MDIPTFSRERRKQRKCILSKQKNKGMLHSLRNIYQLDKNKVIDNPGVSTDLPTICRENKKRRKIILH